MTGVLTLAAVVVVLIVALALIAQSMLPVLVRAMEGLPR